MLAPLDKHAASWLSARYVDFRDEVGKVLRWFSNNPDRAIRDKELSDMVGEDALDYLKQTEVVLPRDFWNPTHFLLDPTASWLLSSHVARR